MSAVVDRVLERWRASGSVDHAVAALTGVATAAESGGIRRPALAEAIAREVAPAHPREHDVQLAAGRMLLAHRELDLAKRHLLLAAKLAPGTPAAPHLLGEALLLQGDAERAARALNAALRSGSEDEACRNWYRAALAYIPFQRRDGAEAVARKVNEGMGGAVEEPAREEPEEIVDEDSFDEPPTQVARIAALPQMPSMPAQATASMFPTDLEPAEEVPRDEATAIVSMDELREMIEEDLREAEERGVTEPPGDDDGDDEDDDALAQTVVRNLEDEDSLAKTALAPPKPAGNQAVSDRPRRAAARPAPTADADAAGGATTPADEPDAPDPAPEPSSLPAPSKAPVVEAPGPASTERAVAEEAAPTPEAHEEGAAPKKKRRSNTPLVLFLLLALIGVLLFGVRTGRLPALAEHLPPWVTGEAPLPFP